MQGASAGTQTCSGSGRQPSEFNRPVQPTDIDNVISATMRPTVAIKYRRLMKDCEGGAEI